MLLSGASATVAARFISLPTRGTQAREVTRRQSVVRQEYSKSFAVFAQLRLGFDCTRPGLAGRVPAAALYQREVRSVRKQVSLTPQTLERPAIGRSHFHPAAPLSPPRSFRCALR